MPSFGGMWNNLKNWLRGKPTPPKLTTNPLTTETPSIEEEVGLGGGHRGIAAGHDLRNPNLSQENIDKWRMLGNESVAGFVYGAEILFVHSSNVEWVQFFIDQSVLHIKFLDQPKHPGGTYRVTPFNETEAIRFVKALSKGGEYWDTVRIRGTRHGHKKNVVRIK